MKSSITIHAASDCLPRTLVNALNDAYADYFVPIRLTPTSLADLIRRESIEMQSSRVAMQNSNVAGMGLLGRRRTRGWIGGMGVVPNYRRQGIGRRIIQDLIAQARELALETLQLEVIQQNKAAYSLYRKMGFITRRELIVLTCHHNAPAVSSEKLGPNITIREEDASVLLKQLDTLPGVLRPWQREFDDNRKDKNLAGYAAYRSGALCGVCIYGGSGGMSAELIEVAADDEVVGLSLLASMLQAHPTTTFSYLNVSKNDPMLQALRRAGFEELISQYEMVLSLS